MSARPPDNESTRFHILHFYVAMGVDSRAGEAY